MRAVGSGQKKENNNDDDDENVVWRAVVRRGKPPAVTGPSCSGFLLSHRDIGMMMMMVTQQIPHMTKSHRHIPNIDNYDDDW